MTKPYAVRDVFLTIQGEGSNSGRRAIFVRFAGCNMWNGEPSDRNIGKGACASWCDTDFRAMSSTKYSLGELVQKVRSFALSGLVVLTGGEPCLQVDTALLIALTSEGYGVAIETNGTVEPKFDPSLVWLCVSPKKLANGGVPALAITRAQELKVVLGGSNDWTNEELFTLQRSGRWGHKWVNPADPIEGNLIGVTALTRGRNNESLKGELEANIELCIDWVNANPLWRIGFQLHKVINVP